MTSRPKTLSSPATIPTALSTHLRRRRQSANRFPRPGRGASSVVIQPDGKIVVAGGAFPLFTFLGNFEVVRYNPNGSLDTSFGNGGIVTTTFPEGSYAFDVALQADGKIIAAGTVFVDFNPGEYSDTDFALARYNPDGTPDATFGSGGRSQPILSVSKTMPFRS